MKMRSVLQECTFDKQFQKSPLVYQVRTCFELSMVQFQVCIMYISISWEHVNLKTLITVYKLFRDNICRNTMIQKLKPVPYNVPVVLFILIFLSNVSVFLSWLFG